MYETSFNTNFITHWWKTIKLCKKPNWCFILIKWYWKTVSFIFDKNIKKCQRLIAFFFTSKFIFILIFILIYIYIFMPTMKEFKEIFCTLFISKHTKKYHQHNVYTWKLWLYQILATIFFCNRPWANWQGQNLREIALIPYPLDRKSFHWDRNWYLM